MIADVRGVPVLYLNDKHTPGADRDKIDLVGLSQVVYRASHVGEKEPLLAAGMADEPISDPRRLSARSRWQKVRKGRE